MYIYCNECGGFFDDGEVIQYNDPDTGAWEEYCPDCHSEDIEATGSCDLCGSPALPGETFCEGCKADMKLAFDNAVAQIGRWHKKPSAEFDKIEKMFLEFIEFEVMK